MVGKRVLVINFSDIFHYATKNFGIHWNPCNDLFFDNVFEYRTLTKIYTIDLLSDIEYFHNKEDFPKPDLPKEIYDSLTPRNRGRYILYSFCYENNIKEDFEVDSR